VWAELVPHPVAERDERQHCHAEYGQTPSRMRQITRFGTATDSLGDFHDCFAVSALGRLSQLPEDVITQKRPERSKRCLPQFLTVPQPDSYELVGLYPHDVEAAEAWTVSDDRGDFLVD
jgi:hypothetical protein